MTRLDKILGLTRSRVDRAKKTVSPAELSDRARTVRQTRAPHRFRAAVERRQHVNIIAEFKRASPSKGLINDRLGPVEAAEAYEKGGAAAISVLTEEDLFRGSLNDLRRVRQATALPVLRKDFIVDEYQVFEAAEAGADAVLLIVAALSIDDLFQFQRLAKDLGLDALVEVHTFDELEIASHVGATLIGVNNRDLRTFDVSLDVSRELIRSIPNGAIMIAESGLARHEDIVELRDLGYSGFLIGETLMRSQDPAGEIGFLVTGRSKAM